MKKIYVKINGITCDHCREKIINSLIKIKNVESITIDGSIAIIEYNKSVNRNSIVENVNNLDYSTSLEMISEKKKDFKKNMSFIELIKITAVIILIAIIINKIFGFNIFNVIPRINSKMTYVMLFVTGLLTSVHCISMCGAINLIASSSHIRNFKKPILYNLGRLISYTLLGGIVGLLGSVFELNSHIQGIIIIMAAIFMFLMALNMMGIVNINLKFKSRGIFGRVKSGSSFIIGLLNGLMPCGPLQAMQIYALSTGSFVYGALSMFLFCLGTIPLMLLIGVISNLLKGNHRKVLSKVSTVLILILSVVMLNRGLLQMGIDISNVFRPNYDTYLKSEIRGDYQYIEFDLSYNGYKDIVVQKGIPVKLVINATEKTLTGCNDAIKINSFDIKQDLIVGMNTIVFTANESGTYTYTCWMGMLKNNIVVVDDLSTINASD